MGGGGKGGQMRERLLKMGWKETKKRAREGGRKTNHVML